MKLFPWLLLGAVAYGLWRWHNRTSDLDPRGDRQRTEEPRHRDTRAFMAGRTLVDTLFNLPTFSAGQAPPRLFADTPRDFVAGLYHGRVDDPELGSISPAEITRLANQ